MEDEIDIRMVKARTWVLQKQPFLGAVALTMKIIPRPGIETMATDGTNCFYDPALLDQISEEHVAGILAEEAYHKAKKHHIRGRGKDPKLWNISCDYQIHNDLLKDGFRFPDFLYHDPQYDGLAAEDIYHLLYQKQQEQEQKQKQKQKEQDNEDDQTSGDGMGSDGGSETPEEDPDQEEEPKDPASNDDEDSGDTETDDDRPGPGKGGEEDDTEEDGDQEGDDDEGDPGAAKIAELANVPKLSGLGMILDPVDEDPETETEIAIRQAMGVAKRALGAGTMPGCMASVLKDLNSSRADWREELRRFADPSCRKDYTWRRPNRRFSTADFFLPGLVSDGVNHMGIVIDGSGSVNETALKRGISECQGMLDCNAVDRFTVIYCDTDVYNIRSYENGDQIELLPARRGGTLFAPAFQWFEDNEPDVSGIVYFTDMFACDWGEVSRFDRPTLWAAYGDPRTYRQIQGAAPFGGLIEINYD